MKSSSFVLAYQPLNVCLNINIRYSSNGECVTLNRFDLPRKKENKGNYWQMDKIFAFGSPLLTFSAILCNSAQISESIVLVGVESILQFFNSIFILKVLSILK